MSVVDFAKLIGKNSGTVHKAIQNHKFTTGEQIIAYCNSGAIYIDNDCDEELLSKSAM